MNAGNSARLTAGILGGMGPEATVDLMRRVIALTPAADDRDHIRMLVDCDPTVPSRIAAIIEGSGPSPAPALLRMARALAGHGADFLAMPCNTAHTYYDDIARAVDVPLINMLENAARRLHAACPQATRVGLLASAAVRITGVYAPHCAAVGCRTLFPEEPLQEWLMALIRDVKAGGGAGNAPALAACAGALVDAGADCLLIACTELSVIADPPGEQPVPVFDAADLLAREIVDRALGRSD